MGPKYNGSNIQGKGDIINCSCYQAMKLFEHGMMVAEGLFEKQLHRMVTSNEIKFGSTSEK